MNMVENDTITNCEYLKPDCRNIPYKITDYIQVIDNIVPDYLCEQILTEFNGSSKLWQPARVSSDNVIVNEIRKVEIINLSDLSVIHENTSTRHQIVAGLNGAVFLAINKYKKIAPCFHSSRLSSFDLLKYQEGCFYSEHTDSMCDVHRHLSISLLLNDDFEGGEFGFFNNNIKIKAKRGSAVIFPSNFMFPHEINPVTKGTRYSIITWVI